MRPNLPFSEQCPHIIVMCIVTLRSSQDSASKVVVNDPADPVQLRTDDQRKGITRSKSNDMQAQWTMQSSL